MLSTQANRMNGHKAIILLLFHTVAAAAALEAFSLICFKYFCSKPRPNTSSFLLKMVATALEMKRQKKKTESGIQRGQGKAGRGNKADGRGGQQQRL